jgi:hypothetical protein
LLNPAIFPMRIPPALRFAASAASFAAVFPAIVHAHPGHDGHDLTWDFGHLASYPLATLGCFLVIAGVAVIAGRALRARTLAARKVKTD